MKGNWVSPSYAEAKGYNYSGLTGGLYRGLIDEVETGIALLKQQGFTEINIKGIFWMQGESDRTSPEEYRAAFTYFASDIRRDLGEVVGEDLSDLPIMIGEISRTCKSAAPAEIAVNETFIEMQRGLAQSINDVYVIASGQYEITTWENGASVNDSYQGDAWHWNTEEMFNIGSLVARCIIDNILNAEPGDDDIGGGNETETDTTIGVGEADQLPGSGAEVDANDPSWSPNA